jgi:hypothetical protein
MMRKDKKRMGQIILAAGGDAGRIVGFRLG